MKHHQNHTSETPGNSRGMSAEMKRLRANGGASLDELREFISTLKGKSPQEMLGIVAQSNLVKSILIATIGFVLVIGALTVVPYLLAENTTQTTKEEDLLKEREKLQARLGQLNSLLAEHDAKENKAPEETPQEAQPAEATTQNQNPATTPEQNPLQQAAKAMGEDEVKNAPSNTNPLEENVEGLLDLNDN